MKWQQYFDEFSESGALQINSFGAVNTDNERQRLAQAIVDKLAVFGIDVELADILVGSSFTRYMFKVLSPKTRMSEFRQYADDIRACAESQYAVFIHAPFNGTNMVGIDVANNTRSLVHLRDLLKSNDFDNTSGELVFVLGMDVNGKTIVADLAKLPHLLIAGAVGTGKSSCINNLIVSLMYKYEPEYLRFIMVDSKCVEFNCYSGMPYMFSKEVISTMPDVLLSMDYLIAQMEFRYKLFGQSGVANIAAYNKIADSKSAKKLPYLVLIVDELADLMAIDKKTFENKFLRLAQKSRAAGIHIVLATQRPDVSVLTGTIRANTPSRIALKVYSQYDSQAVIGSGGAEKLIGSGDMLFVEPSSPYIARLQSAYIDETEVRWLADYLTEIYGPATESIAELREQTAEKDVNKNPDDALYPYYKKALRYLLEHHDGVASIAFIQRGLYIGFNRAGHIMDKLQQMGYVEELTDEEAMYKKPRVLVSLDDLDDFFPDND